MGKQGSGLRCPSWSLDNSIIPTRPNSSFDCAAHPSTTLPKTGSFAQEAAPLTREYLETNQKILRMIKRDAQSRFFVCPFEKTIRKIEIQEYKNIY
jgi:hypothetical protein